jgi:isoleucyl-tRNA synthetase
MASFPTIDADPDFPAREQGILELWSRIDAFRRSVRNRPEDDRFVFYDGPPFATGLPHYGHLVPSTIKDVVPRYWTMRGKRVERRFGWDTHGLPIEMLMEKQLGLSGPSSIRAYGVDKFNEACRDNVFTYVSEWRRIIGRLGRWVDFDDDYKTLDPSFMESVWWAFRRLWDQDLVTRSFRVMPYSWRLSTSLSNFEATSDYRDVQDPALTVEMPVVGGDGSILLIWTTTPWTLPSNLAVAVGAELPYVRARRAGDPRVYVVAEARRAAVLGDDSEIVDGPFPGSSLLGTRYEPLFPWFAATPNAFRVIAAPHVSTEDGTGLVHMAPDFGEEDFAACAAVGIGVLRTVDEEGNFRPSVVDWAGRNIKEADHDIIVELKRRGRVLRHDTLVHKYPYCWRSGTPLIYMAVPAWFVKVTAIKERMVANNTKTHWVPEAVGGKRFGNWLQDARDWNISRNRFWGTPIPIWQCERDESHHVCIGSVAELAERTGAEITDLHPHRIDHLTFACSCGGTMRRISDVFDCWFESGAMPYGQAHYPFERQEAFERTFPAQFIAEGLDQTRGWFYTLLVLSTALFDQPAFQNCVVNGLVLAEDGSKMSKSKQNFPPPERILDLYGADALRAYLVNSPVVRAEPLRFSEAGVRDVVRTVLLPLHHAHAFFVQYANLDGWSPDRPRPPLEQRSELDRWILSHVQTLIRSVDEQMELYQLYAVVPPVLGFIDDLTNWYIRLSRRRFWRGADEDPADKAAAYATLYEVLVTFSQVLAPFLPFAAETLWQSLVVAPGVAGPEQDSVHLTDWPRVDPARIDRDLEQAVAWTRDVVGLGRRLRERTRLKTRQPLRRLTVVHHDAAFRAALQTHTALVQDELNVREVVLVAEGHDLASVTCKANFKTLGKRFGKDMKSAAAVIEAFGASELATLEAGGSVEVLDQAVTPEDVVIRRESKGSLVIEVEGALIVAFDTEVDDALLAEGLAREVVSMLQKLRKETGLAVADRIVATVTTDDPVLTGALRAHEAWVRGEVLATELRLVAGAGSEVVGSVRAEHLASLSVQVA